MPSSLQLHKHVLAATFQLATFRDAAAAAVALDRVLVLPPFYSFCDSDHSSSVLENCTFHGAEQTAPWRAPADAFINIDVRAAPRSHPEVGVIWAGAGLRIQMAARLLDDELGHIACADAGWGGDGNFSEIASVPWGGERFGGAPKVLVRRARCLHLVVPCTSRFGDALQVLEDGSSFLRYRMPTFLEQRQVPQVVRRDVQTVWHAFDLPPNATQLHAYATGPVIGAVTQRELLAAVDALTSIPRVLRLGNAQPGMFTGATHSVGRSQMPRRSDTMRRRLAHLEGSTSRRGMPSA